MKLHDRLAELERQVAEVMRGNVLVAARADGAHVVTADATPAGRAMRKLLREVITRHERGAELPARWLYHNRDTDARCGRCGGAIRRMVVFGRTTYFCSSHQR
jgi:formamidopyrimidine-DNA glycosylase